jgi:excisionase family DNA binding protein
MTNSEEDFPSESGGKLTPKQAAGIAGVSVSLIYQWCEERRLTHYRCGTKGRRGRILIERADLLQFLQCCRVEAAAEAERPRPAAQPAGFTQLDSGRLLEAWQRRGAIADPPGPRSAPSS